jgi:hypothetical protein
VRSVLVTSVARRTLSRNPQVRVLYPFLTRYLFLFNFLKFGALSAY